MAREEVACHLPKWIDDTGRCEHPEHDIPRTIPEQLDAARDGTEFGNILMRLFSALERAREVDDE